MNDSLKHAGEKKLSFSSLSWDEAIRLDAVTEEHVLHMQNIIINQEGIIDDLEIRVTDTERLLDSLEIEEMLHIIDKVSITGNIELLLEVQTELLNYQSRKHNE